MGRGTKEPMQSLTAEVLNEGQAFFANVYRKKNKQQEPNVGEWRVREGPGRVCGSQRPLGRGADVW